MEEEIKDVRQDRKLSVIRENAQEDQQYNDLMELAGMDDPTGINANY